MAKLAEVGFSQSYTYFTWRTERDGAEGLWAYFEELAHGPASDYLRPAFWPNTPDILATPLRNGPREAFALRLVLAAIAAPTYGIYSGYELGENRPASPANEEYLDAEKYQIIVRDYDRADSLAPLVTRLNDIRRRHRALSTMRSLAMHPTDNPAIVAFSKRYEPLDGGDGDLDVVLTAVNLDPLNAQATTITVDLAALGLEPAAVYVVLDELTGRSYTWQGDRAWIRLDPAEQPAHIFSVVGRAATTR
jgi:starch synthase (maltosyl-transferring)